jgi:beta-galactosidase
MCLGVLTVNPPFRSAVTRSLLLITAIALGACDSGSTEPSQPQQTSVKALIAKAEKTKPEQAIPEHVISAQVLQEKVQTQLFNDDWFYLQKNLTDVAAVAAESQWQPVSLPHTWNATDTVDAAPGYRRNASWYKKQFRAAQTMRQVLYFEGANIETQVYVNGQLAGANIGGFIGFSIELTPYVKRGASNELLVRVSNAYNPDIIPSQKADFFIHGGIVRDVWLKTLPDTFIESIAINTPAVSRELAQTFAEIHLNALAGKQSAYRLRGQLLSPEGELLQEKYVPVTGATQAAQKMNFDDLIKPQLWSVDTPNLYSINVQLLNEAGDVVHELSDRFGYRWFEMRPHEGFFVNGERLLIRGTHRHEESAGLGAALPNAMHRSDMQMIKDMGANFVRLAHYPQAPEVYRAADELGLILWDELPWCRGGKGGEVWEKNTESYLQRQIAQNYNHPSIAFWSLGNEMNWEEDFPGGGADDKVTAYIEKLNALVKAQDTSRLTTLRKFYPAAAIVDAFSPSIWAGWYGGAYGQYGEAITGAMKSYPTFLHMEYGGSSHVGRHSETPIGKEGIVDAQVSVAEAMNQAVVKSVAKDSDWNENYIVNLFDWHLHVAESTPGFAGNAQWAFKDFGTPIRPENPIPYVNQKGLVDRNGKPKDAYYVFASYWSKKPFCYIESKTWTHREGPKEGRPVKVFCNTQSAELWLNGKSLGVKQRDPKVFPAGGLVWQVPFTNGLNQVNVIGRSAQVSVEDQLAVTYLIGHHGPFAEIQLTAKPLANKRLLIEAQALDKDGNRVLDFSDRAYFFNLGEAGHLIENQGTPTGSSTIAMANGYAAIEFEPGTAPSTIEFRTQNVKGTYVHVDAR